MAGRTPIRAELVEAELVGSVNLELTGKKRARSTDNEAPYLLPVVRSRRTSFYRPVQLSTSYGS